MDGKEEMDKDARKDYEFAVTETFLKPLNHLVDEHLIYRKLKLQARLRCLWKPCKVEKALL